MTIHSSILPGKSNGQRSLLGIVHKVIELDMTKVTEHTQSQRKEAFTHLSHSIFHSLSIPYSSYYGCAAKLILRLWANYLSIKQLSIMILKNAKKTESLYCVELSLLHVSWGLRGKTPGSLIHRSEERCWLIMGRTWFTNHLGLFMWTLQVAFFTEWWLSSQGKCPLSGEDRSHVLFMTCPQKTQSNLFAIFKGSKQSRYWNSGCTALEKLWGDTPHSRVEKPQQDGRCWNGGCVALEWLWGDTLCLGQRRSPSKMLHFSSVSQSCPTLCNPMNHSKPGLPVHHQLLDSLKLMSIE